MNHARVRPDLQDEHGAAISMRPIYFGYQFSENDPYTHPGRKGDALLRPLCFYHSEFFGSS